MSGNHRLSCPLLSRCPQFKQKKEESTGQILEKKFYLVIRKEKQLRGLKLNLISAKPPRLPRRLPTRRVLSMFGASSRGSRRYHPRTFSERTCWGARPEPVRFGPGREPRAGEAGVNEKRQNKEPSASCSQLGNFVRRLSKLSI